jgi:hypothetical protein
MSSVRKDGTPVGVMGSWSLDKRINGAILMMGC